MFCQEGRKSSYTRWVKLYLTKYLHFRSLIFTNWPLFLFITPVYFCGLHHNDIRHILLFLLCLRDLTPKNQTKPYRKLHLTFD